MFKSAVTESPILDLDQHPEVIAAQSARNGANDALGTARAHQETLFQQQQTDDEVLRYQATLDMPAAQRVIWEKEVALKSAEKRLDAVQRKVRPELEAAWRERHILVVTAFFDALVRLPALQQQALELEQDAKQRGKVGLPNIAHIQFSKESAAFRISHVCRDLGMSTDRWLPLE